MGMTKAELLADLDERIQTAVGELEIMAASADRLHKEHEHVRLLAKASGMSVVRDWLRSYDRTTALLPAESMVMTIARGQLARGDNPPINTTAVLVMIIQRLIGEEDEAEDAEEGVPRAGVPEVPEG